MADATQTMTLTDFLLDRVAEDEAVALAALASHDRPAEEGTAAFVCSEQGMHVGLPPARVLAECEAKRKMVFLAEATAEGPPVNVDAWTAMKMALRFLALPYADHPDYREEWRV